MMIVNAEYSSSSQSTRCQASEFGIFGYLARTPPLLSHYIHASRQDYIYAAHRLPLPPLGPVGLVRAVVATEAAATGVLADTTGSALTTDSTGAALAAMVGAAVSAPEAADETTATAEVTAEAVASAAGADETMAEPPAVTSSAPTVPTGGGA